MDTKELQAAARRWGLYGWTFVKWTAVAAVIGCVCGFIGTLFHFGVHEVTAFRGAHPWVLYLLPLMLFFLGYGLMAAGNLSGPLGGLLGAALGIFIAFGYDRLVLKKKKTVYTIIGYGPSAAH